jgi:hypothetical protein
MLKRKPALWLSLPLLASVALVGTLRASAGAASKEYQALRDNADGSVAVVAPYYYDSPLRLTWGLSRDKSDLDGVCRRYGLGRAREVSATGTEDDRMAVVDATGEVVSFYGHDNPQLNVKITEITCEKAERRVRRRR